MWNEADERRLDSEGLGLQGARRDRQLSPGLRLEPAEIGRLERVDPRSLFRLPTLLLAACPCPCPCCPEGCPLEVGLADISQAFRHEVIGARVQPPTTVVDVREVLALAHVENGIGDLLAGQAKIVDGLTRRLDRILQIAAAVNRGLIGVATRVVPDSIELRRLQPVVEGEHRFRHDGDELGLLEGVAVAKRSLIDLNLDAHRGGAVQPHGIDRGAAASSSVMAPPGSARLMIPPNATITARRSARPALPAPSGRAPAAPRR